jgi:hypothetical protein
VFYTFHCRSLSYPLLSLFVGIFWGYHEWICFSDFFLSLFFTGMWKSYWFPYVATLPKVYIRSRGFLVESLGSFKFKIKSSAIGIIWLLPSNLNHFYWLEYAEPCSHPWNEINFIMMYDLFNVLLNLVCKYFIEKFFYQ